MITPGLSWLRFLSAGVLGMLLGPAADFLGPVRKRFPLLVDLLLSGCLVFGWLELTFGICGGDLRMGYLVGAVLGFCVWRKWFRPLLHPLIAGFWGIVAKVLGLVTLPMRGILKKIKIFSKNSLQPEKNGLQ